MNDSPPDRKRYPLPSLHFALLVPTEPPLRRPPHPDLSPPELILRMARHRFMLSLFVFAPWSAMSCARDLLPTHLDARREQDIWTRILELILAQRARSARPSTEAGQLQRLPQRGRAKGGLTGRRGIERTPDERREIAAAPGFRPTDRVVSWAFPLTVRAQTRASDGVAPITIPGG